jgi:hypothetical protein
MFENKYYNLSANYIVFLWFNRSQMNTILRSYPVEERHKALQRHPKQDKANLPLSHISPLVPPSLLVQYSVLRTHSVLNLFLSNGAKSRRIGWYYTVDGLTVVPRSEAMHKFLS